MLVSETAYIRLFLVYMVRNFDTPIILTIGEINRYEKKGNDYLRSGDIVVLFLLVSIKTQKQ